MRSSSSPDSEIHVRYSTAEEPKRMDPLPKLQFTPNDAIPSHVNDVRNAFHSQKTKPLEFRKQQLRRLYWSIKDNYDALIAACKKDIGKGTFETGLEVDWCMNDCIFVANKLDEWAKDEKAPEIALMNAMLRPKIRKEPLGIVLIIGTYNFPLILVLPPLVGAIAAGNTAIVKPSENAPNVAAVVERVISSTLDTSCFRVIQGAIPETTTLLDQKWDKIFYTGGANVGTIVAKKAAETLTPYTLELGGRNPAIVTQNVNIRKAARRLLWGKTQNAGQVCISQNYTLVERPILEAFVAEMKGALAEFFPSGTRNTDDYGRLVNSKQLQRARSILESTKGKVIVGGTIDESDCYFEPTIILLDSADDPMLQEESFAPLIPIIPFDDLKSAIATANSMESTPLGVYPFGSRAENEEILNGIRSGGASVNDAWMHGTIQTLAFGGVGDSGQGAYRGKASFDCFTHRRSITTTPWWAEKLLAVRYPPYAGKLEQIKKMGSLKPNFDRDGKVNVELLRYVLMLGAGTKSGALLRFVLVALAALGFQRYGLELRR